MIHWCWLSHFRLGNGSFTVVLNTTLIAVVTKSNTRRNCKSIVIIIYRLCLPLSSLNLIRGSTAAVLVIYTQRCSWGFAGAYIKAQSAHCWVILWAKQWCSLWGALWCWLTAPWVGAQSGLYVREGSTQWHSEPWVCEVGGSGAPGDLLWGKLCYTAQKNTFPLEHTGSAIARKWVKICSPQDYLMQSESLVTSAGLRYCAPFLQ